MVFQTGSPARMCRRIAARSDGPRQLKPHHRAELEAVARTGRHQPTLGALFLDHESLVLGDCVEADLQTIDAPALEAPEQDVAALEQRPHLVFAGIAFGRRIADAAE